jgi:predicted nucleotidyltransferase
MKAREGDLIETVDGLIFDVKGLVHPPEKTIAFIRYFVDEKGERKRKQKNYRKIYSLPKRYEWLKQHFPQYLVYDSYFDEVFCEVPDCDVKLHYKPVEKLAKLRKARKLHGLENEALEMATLLKTSANIPWNAIGISGSILVNLFASTSDIDITIYGIKNCSKIYSALKQLLGKRRSPLKAYGAKDLRALFKFRSKDTSVDFKDFVKTESRKVMQGKFNQTDYFIRFVKDWSEIKEKYGDIQYKNLGYARINATISEDSQAIFTPCSYAIENVKIDEGPKLQTITEISSFRGRFCEQAKVGEVVVVQGKIEKVMDKRRNWEYFRLLLGNKLSDFMILA